MNGDNKRMDKGVQLVDPELRRDIAQALGVAHVSNNTALILDLVRKGYSLDIAHRMVTGKHNLSQATESNLKNKSKKWMLASPEMQKLAHNVHKRAMQGKPIVGKYKDKDGNNKENIMMPDFKHAQAAADSVLVRTEPIKQDHGPQSVTNNIQVNVRELFNTQHVVSEAIGHDVSEVECNEINGLSDK
jgi:hypothetical protein